MGGHTSKIAEKFFVEPRLSIGDKGCNIFMLTRCILANSYVLFATYVVDQMNIFGANEYGQLCVTKRLSAPNYCSTMYVAFSGNHVIELLVARTTW